MVYELPRYSSISFGRGIRGDIFWSIPLRENQNLSLLQICGLEMLFGTPQSKHTCMYLGEANRLFKEQRCSTPQIIKNGGGNCTFQRICEISSFHLVVETLMAWTRMGIVEIPFAESNQDHSGTICGGDEKLLKETCIVSKHNMRSNSAFAATDLSPVVLI